MSYLVFARKWRPLSFDDVIGQEHVTATLKKAIEKDRVAHAYIFTGTRGVGKTTTARILARALNCDKGPTVTPCGVCESCKNIIRGSSFDVLEIDGASNNKVDDIRELRDNIGYSSMAGKYRIFVIDEVHMLSISAFNALLKTLEEPPPKVIFIFATTEPHKIPATIQSRCQRFDFRRISTEQIRRQLEKICTQEKTAFTREGLHLIARKADGSMRDALSLLDQVLSYGKESIGEEEVRGVLGLVGGDIYMNILRAVHDKTPAVLLETVQDVLYHGYDLDEFLTGLEEHIRNLLFARVPEIMKSRSEEISPDHAAAFVEQAQWFPEQTLLRMAELARKTSVDLKWSAFPRFLVETLLMKLLYIEDSVSFEELLKRIGPAENSGGGISPRPLPAVPAAETSDGIKKKITSEPVPPPEPVAHDAVEVPPAADAPASPVEPLSPVDLTARWPEFLKLLIGDRPNLGSFMSHAYIASCHETSIDVRFPPAFSFQYNEIIRQSNRDIVHKKLVEFAGKNMELHITMENGDASRKQGPSYFKELAETGPSIQDEIEHEPIIKTVLSIFDGEIIQ